MEGHFEMDELSLYDLASVSGSGDSADAGTPPPRQATVVCQPGERVSTTTTYGDGGTKITTVSCEKL